MTDPPAPSADNVAVAEPPGPYRVLARKYRPTSFAGLIGQEAMVRTLSNAIASGRVAHAFMLTGVRGVGKTTTARIIARALNCVGPDGTGGPTVEPCGQCEPCRAISEDRHVDVIEMDAASRTGVEDIRDLTDGVRYRPVAARYKVYIVDEVHMLSKHAFNALLKTLEEPPAHVKFVLATTEIRKVPVTVLSRCQRFDLRRVAAERLARHLTEIADREGVRVAADAATLLARAADGSVRDGLSLLDQAMALGDAGEGGEVTAERVRAMLGLADRTQVFDLFDAVMRGEVAAALDRFAGLYEVGADPLTVLNDLLELTHWLTRVKLIPAVAEDPTVPEAERVRGRDMAGRLSMPALTRCWQLLLKGLGEAQYAPQPLAAAEMVLVRLAYAAELPNPAELVEAARTGSRPGRAAVIPGAIEDDRRPLAAGPPDQAYAGTPPAPLGAPRAALAPTPQADREPPPEAVSKPVAEAAEPLADPQDFAALVELFERRQPILHAHLRNNVHLVRCEPGRLELRTEPDAPRNLASRMTALLGQWTGRRWVVSLSNQAGAPTLTEQAQAHARRTLEEARRHPLVQSVLEHFPGASIREVREVIAAAPGGVAPQPGDAVATDEEDQA
jgi:DNA polymerase-3 subunit gamma/tau